MKTFKSLAVACLIAAGTQTMNAQNVSISPAPGSPPDPSAGLDVNFTNKGLLIPRVALTSPTDASTISSPALSLLVYNTGTGGLTPAGYYYWDGSKWVKLLITGTPSDAWLTTGNSGTSPSTNFIGTIDNTSLVFRTNNTEQMRLHNTGQLSIGDNTPGGKLDVHQTSSNDVARFTTYGNVNSILLRRTQGTKTSPSSTSGANTVLGRFDAQGYNGSGFTTAARIEMATDAAGGTSTDMPGRITFETTPDGSGTLVERMRITNNGNVGIGTVSPSRKLVVIDTSQSTSWVVSRFEGYHPSTSHFIFQNQNDGNAAVQVRGKEVTGVKYINFLIEPNANNKGGILGNVGSFYLNVGNVGIGTTTPNNKLVVLGGSIVWGNSSEINFLQNDQGGSIELGGTTTVANPVTNGTPYIDFHYGTGVGQDYNVRIVNIADNRLDFVTNSGGTVMSINQASVGIGMVTNLYQLQLSTGSAAKQSSNTWIVTSDERLKSITGTYNKGLKEILQLNPITYYYKNTSDYTFDPRVLEKENIGFSAQQVSKIFPESVIQQPDGYLAFDFHPILVAYVNAIKELAEKDKELELKNKELENKNKELEDKMKEIELLKKDNEILKSEVEKIKRYLDMKAIK
jgi:hypothetical protein